MKKYLVLVSVLLLFISGIFIYKRNKPQIEVSDLIVEVNKDSITKISEESVLNFYEVNKDNLEKVADYLLENEKLFGTRPVILIKNNVCIKKIKDEAVKELTNNLLEEGTITRIYSLNDSVAFADFLVNSEYGIYQQGIRFVSDPKVIAEDKSNYNHIKYYKDLENGWYYYLHYYNEIKDADIFRKIAWDTLDKNNENSVLHDWHNAAVTIEEWDSIVGYKKDKKARKYVIAVRFNTEHDGILGPIVVYLDPSTKKVVGYGARL